ncbi:MAG: PQQ-binding-like beta-propeller repeat protein [Akkermansiaceae bacterium]
MNNRLFTTLVILCCSSLFAEDSSPENTASWTGWRGNDRDAKVSHYKAPEVWPDKLAALWTAKIGDGYATPLVVGDRIFQHTRQNGNELLLCLDFKNGKEFWRTQTEIDFTAGRGGEKHGLGPKSTPTYADGRIFTLSITGLLSAWSAENGKRLWTRNFSEKLNAAHPYWGSATSPIVDGERVIVHTGSCEDGALFCIDAKSGKDLWVNDQYANCYSSPLIETLAGVRQLVELNHSGICGIDLKSGKILWRHPFTHHGNNQNTPTPVRCGDLIVLGGENRGMFAVKPTVSEGNWSVEQIWRHRKVSLDMSSPIAHGDLVFAFSEFKQGKISCLDGKSGAVLWESDARMGKNAQFLSLPEHVLCLTDRGILYVVKPNREKLKIIKEYRVAREDTWTAPALVGDILFTKAHETLVAWKFPSAAGAE